MKMKLGDLATYINGYPFKPQDRGKKGLPIIRIQDLSGNSYDLGFYDGTYPEKIEINNGDVLISWSASLGIYIWNRGKALLNQHIFKVVFDKKTISKDYFVYAVRYALNSMASKTHGATMKHIIKQDFDETEIPYPSLEEQTHIANILLQIEHIIEQRTKQLSALNDLIKSRFVEMFGDIIHNDKCWPKYQFDSITTSRLGKMLDAKKQTGKHSFPYLANCNVQWFHFDMNELKEMDFDEKDRREFELREGDLLVCEGGEIGRCAVWHNEIQPCYYQKAIHRVRCNLKVILPDYLSWWFRICCENNAFQDVVGAKATIAHLPGEKLKKLQVITPHLDKQRVFVNCLAQIDKTKSAIQKSLEETQLLFDSLMQTYFG